ncbi:MAG TPA: glucose-1-phosphate adenylyltransferase [Candidatus Faecalicoccus intestinipullorum]|nr:glucose-1-phosphate adenylyltransferase [Candidatus Faecalicoccus intestinipullorum]
MEQNNMLAMILAGGRGTRLLDLTKKNAKPAVYFGGKYRIIDFPLSNCANSGIKVVGVLTQYESVMLNAYAGAGQRWGLDTRGSGVYVLPPREKDGTKFDVYQGTADAITQNIDFIDTFDPEYVLILSGDHIYKMDYADMLSLHKETEAACTIAVLPVPMKEASRFGIMNTDEEGRIVEFEEKPAHPKSNLASMGIYIFNWKDLRKELIADMSVEGSHHDFGKDIIPSFLNQGKKLQAYKFEGYWKDVGTIDSLWEANMDLLDKTSELNLDDPEWKIYTEDVPALPHYVGPEGSVKNSYINQGAIIRGHVESSVLFNDVTIDKDAAVEQAVLMPGVTVGEGAKVYRAIVADGVKIDPGAVVGSLDSEEIALISKRVKKGE